MARPRASSTRQHEKTTVCTGGLPWQFRRRTSSLPGAPRRMTSVPDDLPLAADFPKPQYEDWRKLVDGVLKGAPFEKLVGKTYDGVKIEPLYPRAKGVAPVEGRPAAAPRQIVQRSDHPDAAAANKQALADLENGAT